MQEKNVWIWILSVGAVLLLTAGIFFIAFPKNTGKPLPNRPGQTIPNGTIPNTPGTTPGTSPTPTPGTHAPFVITTMTHMEEDFTDDVNKAVFDRHVTDMRWAMKLFDEYGAKLTFESEQPFAKANTNWNLNILKEAIDDKHGVGTHAGFGAKPGLSADELAAKFKENKTLVDDLVGTENNQGVSGGTGPTDWIIGAATAGFHYYDAVTGFGYLSMPESARPRGWNNSYILKTGFHDSIPPNLIDRIYPIPMKDAKDFVPDVGAQITMMSGDLGELSSLAEGRSNCTPNCVLGSDDITVIKTDIDEILANRDTSRFAKINFHIPMELLDPKNETILRSMLSMIKTYTDKGELSWDTQLGAYKQYVSWGK